MSLDRVVKCHIPRIKLETCLATKSLTDALQSWPWKGFDSLPRH